MKLSKKVIAPMAFILIGLMVVLQSCKKPIERCKKVSATGRGDIVSQTPTGATTESEITGTGLNGMTIAHLVFTGADSLTGNLLYQGDLVLTNKHGSFTCDAKNGILNSATGEFSNDAYIISGTDSYKEATGTLHFHGISNADGSFVDDVITGEICKGNPDITFK